MQVLGVSLADPEDATQRIKSALARDPAVDGMLTLGPGRRGAGPGGTAGDRPAGTDRGRDLRSDAGGPGRRARRPAPLRHRPAALPPGLPRRRRCSPSTSRPGRCRAAGEIIRTGPSFVTKENAADVIALAERGRSGEAPDWRARRPELGRRARPARCCGLARCFAVVGRARRSASLEGTAAVLNAAAPLGILAVAVALLMIAGEFDLSIGSIIGAAGMTIMLLTRHFDWPLWPAIGVAVAAQPRDRLRQRLPRRAHRPPLLHRHPRHALRLPRAHHRGEPRSSPAAPSSAASTRCRGTDRRRRLFAQRALRAVPGLDALVARPGGAGDLGAAPHPVRQLDLRGRRGAGGGAEDGRPGGTGEDRALHDHGARGVSGGGDPGGAVHRRRRAARGAAGVPRHHRRR